MITHLHLKNFTAFSDLKIDFSPKINVIIGENGTGKTQLLKGAYALCLGGVLQGQKPSGPNNDFAQALTHKLLRLFMPINEKLGDMRRLGLRGNAQMKATFAQGEKIALNFNGTSNFVTAITNTAHTAYRAEPIFIPTKELLSLVRGITDASHDQRTVELIFDDGYLDLAKMLLRERASDSESKINLDPRFNNIVPMLTNLIGGRYQLRNAGFCFQPGAYIETLGLSSAETKAPQTFQKTITKFVPTKKTAMLSSGMTAEGFRKVGVLQRLLTNGTLRPGLSGPLLWDEPESNLNPKLIKHMAEFLIELSRNGQQVILATHDYVLLKWFDLLIDKGKDDHVRFHALYRDSKGTVMVESADDYNLVGKSAISDTFAELYDEDVKRALS